MLSGLTSRKCIQAIVATIAFLITSHCYADTVTVNFTNVTGSTSVKYSKDSGSTWQPGGSTYVQAGQYNWTRTAGVSYLDVVGQPGKLQTFCIELSQSVASGTTYTVTTTLVGLPIPGGSGIAQIDAAKEKQIQTLVNAYKTGALAAVKGATAATVDVIQATLWNIINETVANDWSVSTGAFQTKDSSASSTWEGYVNAALDYVRTNWGSYNSANASYFAVGLTSGTGQDQITIVSSGTYHSIPPVPAPAGLLLAGVGIGCLGGFGFLRRHKRQAAI